MRLYGGALWRILALTWITEMKLNGWRDFTALKDSDGDYVFYSAALLSAQTLTQEQADDAARLINATPDLLVALVQLRKEVYEMTQRTGWAGNGGLALADLAIAKVTSE